MATPPGKEKEKEKDEAEKLKLATLSMQLRRSGSSARLMLSPGRVNASDGSKAKFLAFLSEYLANDLDSVMHSIVDNFEFRLARNKYNFERASLFQAAALSLRDRMVEHSNDTHELYYKAKAKRAYYLSIEYLLGRMFTNALISTGLAEPFATAIKEFGEEMETIADREQDAALGSGGLGRLAACFLDSCATLSLPVTGYGVRYRYGQFRQVIVGNRQIETPEFWLEHGNPWEIQRLDVQYLIPFGGGVRFVSTPDGGIRAEWHQETLVGAVAFDMLMPGFGTRNVNTLRLWSSKPICDCSPLETDPWEQLKRKQADADITSVLYPRSDTEEGRELRLKQQFFFCCASIQDILRRFKKQGVPLSALPEHVSIQVNDTHPAISIPELMRQLVDVENMPWEAAWSIVSKVFSFTNHTVLSEALEKWPVWQLEKLLPRHMQIIFEINARFLADVRESFTKDDAVVSRLSIIEESNPKMVRMANLAIVASHTVNGVAQIHTDILKSTVFADFFRMWPSKFINITNGVTPRRWVHCCNPVLSDAISRHLGTDKWITDFGLVSQLREKITPQLLRDIGLANRAAKERLRSKIAQFTDGRVADIDPTALFDTQIKRIHEYKRQLLCVLGIIHRYLALKALPVEQRQTQVKRLHIFAGKAAASYCQAKAVIRLINNVADVLAADAETRAHLRVVFIPNYSVTIAEHIIPATDLSEHISCAGYEASGTSNMKFAMNAGLILGTLDGANVEIAQNAGAENLFIFGATSAEVEEIHRHNKPTAIDQRLHRVIEELKSGRFGDFQDFRGLITPLESGNDYYLVAHDFAAYLDAQARADTLWKDQAAWHRKCVLTMAGTGSFSSDVSISKYAQVWGVHAHKLPPTPATH